jgi:hypothetical protein
MTARRVTPPRRPTRPQRPTKEKDIESDLRQARASRRAEAQQKQRLRRQEWDNEVEDVESEPGIWESGDGGPDDRDAGETRGADDGERP